MISTKARFKISMVARGQSLRPGLFGFALALLIQNAAGATSLPPPLSVDLRPAFDNAGISAATHPTGGGFDERGHAFAASTVPPAGVVTFDATPFRFPDAHAGYTDLTAHGQTIGLPAGTFTRGYLLVAATAAYSGPVAVRYADGTQSLTTIGVEAWNRATADGAARTAAIAGSVSPAAPHAAFLDSRSFYIDQTRRAVSVVLPPAGPGPTRLRIFALTLIPRANVVAGTAVGILAARSTTRTRDGLGGAQYVDATIANTGTDWFTPQHPAKIAVVAPGITTVDPVRITALAPGERVHVAIGITRSATIAAGTPLPAEIVASIGNRQPATFAFTLRAGVPAYTAATLHDHETPDWFNNAKFGIFIHWGVYAVPAFSRVGDYAEWYWNWIHDRNSLAYEHQLQKYGRAADYDDFIPNFRAEHFDPKAWVDLFAAAGARYFVLTSKHHEGFTLFDTATTDRNAVKMGPHRDLVGALFAAARRYQPALHPAVYYSLYEWYNPLYTGQPVRQYFNERPIPYTGLKPVGDYVTGAVLPQLHELIDHYHPALIWCDGEWNKPRQYWHDAATFAYYYNAAQARGQNVAIDDRCRTLSNDRDGFDFFTPEYSTFGTTVERKWEASRGMGYSYGYNAAEQPKDYKTSAELIESLVDMVSKNGNLLLDIGPKADGTIPAIMQDRLRGIGAWLRVNGEAIYDTQYWWQTPQDGDLRFTVKPNRAFYVISLVRPARRVVVRPPVPIAPQGTITLLGAKPTSLHWHREHGYLIIEVPDAARNTGSAAWTFKLASPGSAL